MNHCRKCDRRLWPWNKWKEDKTLCWNCGFCTVTEYIADTYGEEARQEIYKIEEKHIKNIR